MNKMKNINYHFMMKTDGNTLLELLNFSLVQINIKIVVEYLKLASGNLLSTAVHLFDQ